MQSNPITPQAKQSPMQQQYFRIKAELPANALLLIRLGDFFEAFGDDAKDLAKLCNITLAKRGEMPMSGFPCHAAKSYLSSIINSGRLVAAYDDNKPVDLVALMA